MSANSYGSVRRLKILGRRSRTNGSAQTPSVPCEPLLHEHDLPVVEAQAEHVAVVAEVEEEVARALLGLAGQVGQQVEAVDVVLVGAADGLIALLQLVDDVGAPAMARKVGSQS